LGSQINAIDQLQSPDKCPDLRPRDAGIRADDDHSVDLSGGDTLDPGVHDHLIQGLIELLPGFEDSRKEIADAEI
jgi:hypothetical protein